MLIKKMDKRRSETLDTMDNGEVKYWIKWIKLEVKC